MTKKTRVSPQVVEEAMQVAKATQRPGQTKEQTKFIAQGIQKGIEEYKKRHKEKARELDKQKRKLTQQQNNDSQAHQQEVATSTNQTESADHSKGAAWVPWTLLALSWLGFIGYFLLLHP
ncbi:DUF2956 domain-containing protein [Motilimonas sp. KMU-193]|uniref:DUF2956 domain-containing protein n=1 Tax=Motilimonas sp. KMU-193 TaxID=3388668 RepID=UPI00396B036D